MAKLPGIQTTAITMMRGDGTVHFKYPFTTSERVCQWGLASLWVVAPLLAIAVLW
jgi:hypothetical protein